MANWVDIQQNTFTRWCNEHLKDRGLQIKNLQKDLCDGLMLINLVEIISGKSVGRYNKHPRVPYQKLENNGIALHFLKDEGIKLVNISSEDITNGQLKLILGLIWTLILRYHINKISLETDHSDQNTAKGDLLKWVQSKIPEYNITGFKKDWNDGKAICALVDALQPGLCPDHKGLNPKNSLENATKGIDTAYEKLGVSRLLLPDEMVHPRVDELAVMTYISQFRNIVPQQVQVQDDASRCRAYGPGLVEGIVEEPANFFIEMPSNLFDKLEVKVQGPKSTAPVKIKKNDDGTVTVTYEPKEPGEYLVSVTINGVHIPGSVFKVTVLETLSLGGEGKIRVFYSTTSATDDKMRPLQELLEGKAVHLRPDFEPWIPVDLMLPVDRDAVFKKAGTNVLPIVYIDDKYVGDYKKILELNGNGELDRLLKINEGKIPHGAVAKPGGHVGPMTAKAAAKPPAKLLNMNIGKDASIPTAAPAAQKAAPKLLNMDIGKSASMK